MFSERTIQSITVTIELRNSTVQLVYLLVLLHSFGCISVRLEFHVGFARRASVVFKMNVDAS